MKNDKAIFIFIVCMSLIFFAFDQNSNLEIRIAAHPFSIHHYNIDIRKSDGTLSIVYSKVDSVYRAHGKDSVELHTILDKSSNYALSKEVQEKNHNKLELWIQKHSFYTKDSIELEIKNQKDYSLLLDSVFYLKQENIETLHKNRYILDGTYFHIYMSKNNKLETKLLVHAPSREYNPLIFRLITESLDLYKLNHSYSFLNNNNDNN